MANYKAYNPQKVSVNFKSVLGSHTCRAFGADAMVEVAYDSDFGEIHKPTDGENRHVDLQDRSGTITVTLADHSATNEQFSLIAAANVPAVVTITDKSSVADLFVAGSVKIKTHPGIAKGKSNTEYAWVWQFTKGITNLSGAVE